MLDHARAITTSAGAIPTLGPVTTPIRELDETLWALLVKPGRLPNAEWAFIEARARLASDRSQLTLAKTGATSLSRPILIRSSR